MCVPAMIMTCLKHAAVPLVLCNCFALATFLCFQAEYGENFVETVRTKSLPDASDTTKEEVQMFESNLFGYLSR